jgi:hypothetical protein
MNFRQSFTPAFQAKSVACFSSSGFLNRLASLAGIREPPRAREIPLSGPKRTRAAGHPQGGCSKNRRKPTPRHWENLKLAIRLTLNKAICHTGAYVLYKASRCKTRIGSQDSQPVCRIAKSTSTPDHEGWKRQFARLDRTGHRTSPGLTAEDRQRQKDPVSETTNETNGTQV